MRTEPVVEPLTKLPARRDDRRGRKRRRMASKEDLLATALSRVVVCDPGRRLGLVPRRRVDDDAIGLVAEEQRLGSSEQTYEEVVSETSGSPFSVATYTGIRGMTGRFDGCTSYWNMGSQPGNFFKVESPCV